MPKRFLDAERLSPAFESWAWTLTLVVLVITVLILYSTLTTTPTFFCCPFLFCLLYDSAEGEDAFNRPPLIRARCVEAFKLLFVSLPVSY